MMRGSAESAAEDAFIRSYMPMINASAVITWCSTGKHYELDDLKAYGMLGALKAYRSWDPTAGRMAFEAYVFVGIRNAIYSGVREMAPMPRRAMARAERDGLALGSLVADAVCGEWSPCPETEAIAAFDARVLRREVRALPKHSGQADAVAAMLLAGTFEGAAETLGVNRGSVHYSHRIGVETLRKRMVAA